MYERMLNKEDVPTKDEMTGYCGVTSKLFLTLNEWLTTTFETEQKTVFPYGNNYGWGIAHKKKGKLICNIFAEKDAFNVMMRLSDKKFDSLFNDLSQYSKDIISNKFPCGDGGWIHYRVISEENCKDIMTLLAAKL